MKRYQYFHSRIYRSEHYIKVLEMDKLLNIKDFKELEGTLCQTVEQDRRYWRVNDVKCDAIHTAKTYEEFSDRVAAAHLRPLERTDRVQAGSCKTLWNPMASADREGQGQ